MNKDQWGDIALSTGAGALGGAALGLPGAIVGGALGLGTGIAGAVAENKLTARNKSLEAERMDRYRSTLSMNSEDFYGFKARGNNLGGYYKFGGRITGKGGQFKNLSSTGKLIVGAKHSQGGVKLDNGAEVEGGEVIVGDKVYSDVLPFGDKTFAKKALELSNKQGKLEEDMMAATKKRNKYKFNTVKRLSDFTMEELNGLFEVQEEMKEESGIPDGGNKMWGGGEIYDRYGYSKPANIEHRGVPNSLGRVPYPNLPLVDDNQFYESPYNRYDMGIIAGQPKESVLGDKWMNAAPHRARGENMVTRNITEGNWIEHSPTPTSIPVANKSDGKPSFRSRFTDIGAKGLDAVEPRFNNAKKFLSEQVSDFKDSEFGKTATSMAPMLADNLQAMVMNRRLRRMEIPKPSYMAPVALDKRVDISGQLSEMDAVKGSTFRGIDRGVADSSTALAMKSRSAHAIGVEKGKLYDNKSNLERQIRNKETELNLGVAESNLKAFDQYRGAQFAKDMQTEISNPSANVINAVDDWKYVKDKEEAAKLEMLAMEFDATARGGKGLDDNYLPSLINYDEGKGFQWAKNNTRDADSFNRMLKAYPKNSKTYNKFLEWGKQQGFSVQPLTSNPALMVNSPFNRLGATSGNSFNNSLNRINYE